MKIGIVGDVHWSKYSSILRTRGEKYSIRLENCIQSISWAENIFYNHNCDMVVYLGDFFDNPSISAEEIRALKDVDWSLGIPHFMLVGNHEMGINSLTYSSAHVFNLIDFMEVIDKPKTISNSNIDLCFVPYILNPEKPLDEYIGPNTNNKRIVFSHNDIAGIQMGKFISKEGFSIADIESSCDLFLNGHLHNGEQVSDKIYNVGNITGQNFSEDGFKYKHNIFVVNTDTLDIEIIENPYAINFYKLDSVTNLNKIVNGVITLKINEADVHTARQELLNLENIICSRMLINPTSGVTSDIADIDLSVDHLAKFKEFILDKLGNSDLIVEELFQVVK